MNELSLEQRQAIQRLIWEEKYIVHNVIKGVNHCHIIKNKRFNTWIFKGGGSKNYLKQFLAFERDYKCIAQIQDINGYRQFMPFKSWQDCWKVYATTGYNHRYLSEVIISDNYCKPYLDIEWKKDKDEVIDIEPIIAKLKLDLLQVFLNRYNILLHNKHILILSSHSAIKISFHIIINCCINNTYYVFKTNRKREQNSAWDLYRALTEINVDYKTKIDESVYSLDREFRAIYSTKYGEMRQLIPYPKVKGQRFCDNCLDYLVTHFNENCNFKIINTPEYINPKLNVIKKINKLSEIKGHHVNDYKRQDGKVDQDLLDRIYELVQFIHPSAYFTGMTSDNNGWRFTYSDKSEPCFTGKIHQNNGFSVFIKPSNGNIYMYCYSTKCGKLYKLGNLHYDIKWKHEALRVNYKYLEYKINIKSLSILDNEDVKFSGLLNNFIENGGNYVIKSNMGTGKTQLLKTIIKHKFSDKRIIYFSHRQTFTQNIAGTFKELHFYNYLDGLHDICDKDKIIIQIDSLRHLIDNNQELKYYDLVILDEIESLLCHLSSPTLADKRNIICLIIKQILTNAKWVLSMDADFSNRSYEFLSHLISKPKIIINEYKTVKKQFLFNSNYDVRSHQLLEDIRNNKNIVIICLSKNMVDTIYNKIIANNKDTKIIRYTSMTDDEQKKALNNVNDEWVKYQVVMYSPTIESGLDFNKEHFHKIYCFLNNGSCSPRSFLQMIGRIRTVEDNNIRCCYDKMMKFIDKKTYIPSVDEIENMITNNEFLCNNHHFVAVDNTKCKLEIKTDAFTRTFAYNYLENYEKMVHFLPVLKELIVKHEWEYLNEDAGEKEVVINELNNVEDNNKPATTIDSTHEEPEVNVYECLDKQTTSNVSKKTEELDELLDAPVITATEASKLIEKKNANNATRSDKMMLEKYRIMKKFNLKEEDFTMEFLLNWRGKEHILDNVLYYVGKLKYNDKEDQYLNMMKQRKKYVDIILSVFGFKNLFDFTTEVTKDEAMENRMIKSRLLEWDEYSTLMFTFNKRSYRDKETCKVTIKAFIILAEAILNEYGIGIKSKRSRIRDDTITDKDNRILKNKYMLYELRKGLQYLI